MSTPEELTALGRPRAHPLSQQFHSSSSPVNISSYLQRHTTNIIVSLQSLFACWRTSYQWNFSLFSVFCFCYMYILLILFSILIRDVEKQIEYFKVIIITLNCRTQPSMQVKILVNFINH